ncbi:MAG TPA: HAMP domain-containing sensor histidine kinase [Dehalococcoidia bacterium]|jgi:signal transduction histidine kinase|nr:HAMP domain-containing sensor histidine kinase [Dehalococcoidia bacterium]
MSGAMLALAIGTAVLVAQVTMEPPRSELMKLAAYLGISGCAAGAVGWLVWNSRWASRNLDLRSKAFAGSLMGGVLGLLNVFLIARLMFISTSHDLWVVAAAIGFSVVLMTAFSLTVASSVAQRLELISGAVRALAEGRSVPDLGLNEADEVAHLAGDVSRLSEKLEASERERARLDRQRVDLTAAISHDLRTPLASVRAMAEALAEGVVDDEAERDRYYRLIQREIERLDRMIGDLFDLAQIDAGALKLQTRRLPLQEIVAEVVDAMQPQATRKGISLSFETPPDGLPDVEIDGGRFERAVSNLVRNAIEHTSAGGEIRASIAREGGWLALTVQDDGEGFDTALTEQVWERFYRADKSRGHAGSGDGAGLGLSIVRGFVEAHGGQVECTSKPGHGAVFRVRLPAH